MVYVIKKALDIYVNTIIVPGYIHHAYSSADCMVCASVWPESIGMIMELRFTYRLQHLQNALLNEPVPDTGDSERTLFITARFRNQHSSYRGWFRRAQEKGC